MEEGGGCESDLTSTPVEMCKWGGPVGLRLKEGGVLQSF